MTARDAILSALSGEPADAATIARQAAALIEELERPGLDASLCDAFLDALGQASVGATTEHIENDDGVWHAVRRYLDRHGLSPVIHVASPDLPPVADGSPVTVGAALPVDGGAVVARAVAAVAETGTLVIDTGPNRPMLPHFLALHHIVIVRTADLVAQLEDIPDPAHIPRSRFWITGVSGTTDIEGQYVRGAHGPRFLHVILIADQAGL